MPRLRRLHANGSIDDLAADPAVLPPRPAGWSAGLQWLRVCDLPRDATISLLQAYGPSLLELQLVVGTKEDEGEGWGWPYCCGDLEVVLGQCGLRALRRLLLGRTTCTHNSDCTDQIQAVRAVLPVGVTVQCSVNHNVTPGAF